MSIETKTSQLSQSVVSRENVYRNVIVRPDGGWTFRSDGKDTPLSHTLVPHNVALCSIDGLSGSNRSKIKFFSYTKKKNIVLPVETNGGFLKKLSGRSVNKDKIFKVLVGKNLVPERLRGKNNSLIPLSAAETEDDI